MTDKELRALQNEFLEQLDETGFHKRNKDSYSIPLFDKNSPTIIQVQRDLWPSYTAKFAEFVALTKQFKALRDQVVNRPAYFKHHGKPDNENPVTPAATDL